MNQFCPYCGTLVDQTYAFCPHCGKSLESLREIGLSKQIYIYLISLFLPPSGVVYAMRYLKSENPQVKRVGLIACILTVISLLMSVWFIFNFVHQFQDAMGKYSNI